MKKRLISIVVLLCMTLGVFSAMSFSVSADDGTVTIASVDDWMEKLSGKTVGNANIVVTARELDFDGKTVEPVQGFSGYFDGKGVVIKNMTITTDGETGMFNCLAGEATFENFTVTDSSFTGKQWVGVIACCTDGNVTVNNVYISDTVTVTATNTEPYKSGKTEINSYAGGLFGGFAGETEAVAISDCMFAGEVVANGRYCGGLVGDSYNCGSLTITDSIVTGKVPAGSANNYSCGFVGYGAADNDKITLTNCIYAGGAEDSYYYNSPFFKEFKKAEVTNCYTVAANSNKKVYNDVKYDADGSGVVKIDSVAAIYGAKAEIDGFTAREGDIVIPDGIAALKELNDSYTVPDSRYKGTIDGNIVRWVSEGVILEADVCESGDTPEYNGADPKKAETFEYRYNFSGFSPEAAAVTEDTTYTARFEEIPKTLTEITIASVDEWLEKLSGKTVEYADVTVTAKVLDFEGKTVEPIKGFSGKFNGNGVVIKNLHMGEGVAVNGENGIFGCISTAATIENMVIVSSSFAGTEWVGAVACCVGGGDPETYETGVTVRNIYVGADVTVSCDKQDCGSAGGIVGGLTGEGATISSCVFEGKVDGKEYGRYIGGIVGNANGKKATVTGCLFTGELVGNAEYVSGIIDGGDSSTPSVKGCISLGTAGETKLPIACNGGGSGNYDDIRDVYGAYPKLGVLIDGFTARDKDVMIPDGIKALEDLNGEFSVPASKLQGSLGEEDTYTVQWMNGTAVLGESECIVGEEPVYSKEPPTKADFQSFSYEFSGWKFVNLTEDGKVIYEAVFDIKDNTPADTGDSTDTEPLDSGDESGEISEEPKGIPTPAIVAIAVVAAIAVAGSVAAIILGTKKKQKD